MFAVFETSYMFAHSMRNSDQVLHGDQTRPGREKIYTWSKHAPCPNQKKNCDSNADARSVCGSYPCCCHL